VPAWIVVLVAAAWLARALGSFSAWQVRSLLVPRPQTPSPVARRRALWIHLGVAGALVLLTVVIWAATGHGYFWPVWVLLPLGLLFAIHMVVELAVQKIPREDSLTRGVAIHGGVVAALFVFVTAIWAVTTRGDFWPAWVLLGIGSPLLVQPRRAKPEA
jgi:hypothetical protein